MESVSLWGNDIWVDLSRGCHRVSLKFSVQTNLKMWRQRTFSTLLNNQFYSHISNPPSCEQCLSGWSLLHTSTRGQNKSCQLEGTTLRSRSLVRLQGPHAKPFLQGLITNDIGHLETRPSLYTLFLNHQGRVLYDALIYALPEETLLIECDASLLDKFIKHLKLFRVKKKVDIEAVEEKSLWVVYDPGHKYAPVAAPSNSTPQETEYNLKEGESCCAPLSAQQHSSKREELSLIINALHFGDPRLPQLGWRVILDKESDKGRLSEHGIKLVDTEEGYQQLRYSLGVAEGSGELPLSNCFPLESNGDYLHGISFQKGCYVGQELTARTYHTGVVRKRLMPFTLGEGVTLERSEWDSLQLKSEKDRPVGKVRALSALYGVALVRVEEALQASHLKLGERPVRLEKPSWWPIQASKELTSGRKS